MGDHRFQSVGDQAESENSERHVVFISHANPEDNAAAGWFATQLTLLGYEVWCDIQNAHGGEGDFWLKAQRAIENSTAKFVFILSNASADFERKRGVYREVQAADNLRIDNFILSMRIEKLTRSIPILLGTSLYIDAENWLAGLHELEDRLVRDRVPKTGPINFEKINAWWPALIVDRVLVTQEPDEIVSNIFSIESLPSKVHVLQVVADGNVISDSSALRRLLPKEISIYAFNQVILTFASELNFENLPQDVEIETQQVVDTEAFLETGFADLGINPELAINAITFLVRDAWASFLYSKALFLKRGSRRSRNVWFVGDKRVPNNRVSVVEPNKRKASIQLVGKFKSYRKTYLWHVGLLSTISLAPRKALIATPKVVVSPPYDVHKGEIPAPIDDQEVRSGLNWWNKEWRQKLLGVFSWLSDGKPSILVPAGYQHLTISSLPIPYAINCKFREIDDDEAIDRVWGRKSA